VHSLEGQHLSDLIQLAGALSERREFASVDSDVSESIFLRGERYATADRRFDYDVALSFAGSDRKYAERLAEELRAVGVAVFYDQFDQAALWGKNLHAYLTELYRLRARYCVVFLSANYGREGWTRLELDAALAREFEYGHEYILPIRLDDTTVPGILPTRGYLDWRKYSVDAIVDMVRTRLANSTLHQTGPSLRSTL
jgi:hypothetical protein